MMNKNTRANLLERLIDISIEEDISTGDLATNALITKGERAKATITAKADGIISGLEVSQQVLGKVARDEASFTPSVEDGTSIYMGDTIAVIEGSYRDLLTSERLMLNFLQRMSGIATATRQLVELIKGTKAQLLDTRKTAPGHRLTDKMAVRHGGGNNHRLGLYDMAMIKDNHIKAAGSITKAIKEVRATTSIAVKIEVETTNLQEVREALRGGADIIMLDNMSTQMMKEAVTLIDGRAKTEASGNITSTRIREVAETGVDFISVGALTHSVMALDMSMNFEI